MSDPTAWMDDAKCAGVKDFTEWPRESRAILCKACPVVGECRAWGGKPVAPRRTRARSARRKGYCIHGHNTLETGRTKSGACAACQRERKRRSYTPSSNLTNAEPIAQIIDASGMSLPDIARESGVPYETVLRLRSRRVKRVQVASARAITEALEAAA